MSARPLVAFGQEVLAGAPMCTGVVGPLTAFGARYETSLVFDEDFLLVFRSCVGRLAAAGIEVGGTDFDGTVFGRTTSMRPRAGPLARPRLRWRFAQSSPELGGGANRGDPPNPSPCFR